MIRSFGLREKPTELRCTHDVIGRIFNGFYLEPPPSKTGLADKAAKKRQRDEKYSISATSTKNTKKRMKFTTSSDENRSSYNSKSNSSSVEGSSDSGKVGGVRKSGKNMQKLRKMGSGDAPPGGSGARLPPSAKNFRKTNGYFRKKLRAQTDSEFSLG